MASTATEKIEGQVAAATEKTTIGESPKKKEECIVKTDGEKPECVENGKEVSPKKAAEKGDQKAEESAAVADEVEEKNGHHHTETACEENGTATHKSPAKSQQKKTLSQHQSDAEEPSPKKMRKSLEQKPAVEADSAVTADETAEDSKNGETEASA